MTGHGNNRSAHFTYQTRKRTCMTCRREFNGRGRQLKSGRWEWIDHICPNCKVNNERNSIGCADYTYPCSPPHGAIKMVGDAIEPGRGGHWRPRTWARKVKP